MKCQLMEVVRNNDMPLDTIYLIPKTLSCKDCGLSTYVDFYHGRVLCNQGHDRPLEDYAEYFGIITGIGRLV